MRRICLVSDIGTLDDLLAALVGVACGALALLWAFVALVIVRLRARDFERELRKSMFGAAVFAGAGLIFYPASQVRSVAAAFDLLAMVAVFVVPILAVGGTIWVYRRDST